MKTKRGDENKEAVSRSVSFISFARMHGSTDCPRTVAELQEDGSSLLRPVSSSCTCPRIADGILGERPSLRRSTSTSRICWRTAVVPEAGTSSRRRLLRPTCCTCPRIAADTTKVRAHASFRPSVLHSISTNRIYRRTAAVSARDRTSPPRPVLTNRICPRIAVVIAEAWTSSSRPVSSSRICPNTAAALAGDRPSSIHPTSTSHICPRGLAVQRVCRPTLRRRRLTANPPNYRQTILTHP